MDEQQINALISVEVHDIVILHLLRDDGLLLLQKFKINETTVQLLPKLGARRFQVDATYTFSQKIFALMRREEIVKPLGRSNFAAFYR